MTAGLLNHVARPESAFREPTMAELIDRHALACARWTPANDGAALDIADEIKVRLMADYRLSKAQVDELGRVIL